MANMVRFFPNRNYDFSEHMRELPMTAVPGMEGWTVYETPGHTPGHISFFRPADRVLLAGDAFATVNQASAFAVLTMKPEVSVPPTYYTCDWEAAYDSVARLSELDPEVIGAGHGEPMFGAAAREGLRRLATEWPQPVKGRYVNQPAKADHTGPVYIPPPAPDPVKWITVGVATAGAIGAGVLWKRRRAA